MDNRNSNTDVQQAVKQQSATGQLVGAVGVSALGQPPKYSIRYQALCLACQNFSHAEDAEIVVNAAKAFETFLKG